MEKFFGKKIATEDLNIEGFEDLITFDIYDGHAVCMEHKGHRYDMTYPRMSAVRTSKGLQDAIIDYCPDITDAGEISVFHVLETFNTTYEDGVKLEPVETESKYLFF